jgi:hypothetical protein
VRRELVFDSRIAQANDQLHASQLLASSSQPLALSFQLSAPDPLYQ